MSRRISILGRSFDISAETRDHFLVTVWLLVTVKQFRFDELILYPLALYFFWAFMRDFRQIFEILARSYVLWFFPIWWFLSLAWGEHPGQTLKSGLQLVLTLMICYGAVLRLRPRQIMVSVWIAAGYFGLLSFIVDPLGSSAKGVFKSKNSLGGAMVLFWVAGLCMALDPGLTRKIRIAAAASLPLAFWMIQVSNSATATLLAMGSCTAVVFLRFRSLLSPIATVATVSLLVSFALIYGSYAALDVVEINPVKQVLRAFGKNTTLTGRTVLWEYATVEIRNRPLLGVGPGGFWTPEDPFSVARRIYDEFHKVYNATFGFHNSYYETAVHFGLIGLGLLVITTLWTFCRIFAFAIVQNEVWAIFFTCIALITIATSVTEVVLMSAFHLLFMLFIMGSLLTCKSASPSALGTTARPGK